MTKAIPCFRCGAPVAENVAQLLTRMSEGTVSATKAYYHHGGAMDEGAACGAVLRPGAAKERGDYLPFRAAVKKATDAALLAEGFVRILHVPVPVKAGGTEEATAREASARIQGAMNVKVAPGTVLSDACLFVRLPSGDWADRATVATVTAAVAPAGAPPSPVAPPMAPPPPPAPPVAIAPPPPPPPPAPVMVHVATASGVQSVDVVTARTMLATKEAYSAFVNGVWGTVAP